jgi:hypothetical protein
MNTEQDQRVRKLAYGYRVWKPRSDRHRQHKSYMLIDIHTKAIGSPGFRSTGSRKA